MWYRTATLFSSALMFEKKYLQYVRHYIIIYEELGERPSHWEVAVFQKLLQNIVRDFHRYPFPSKHPLQFNDMEPGGLVQPVHDGDA